VLRWDVSGSRALFRWDRFGGGLIRPGEFALATWVAPDGSVAAIVGNEDQADSVVVGGADQGWQRIEADHGVPGLPARIIDLSWSPDSSAFVTGAGDSRVKLWDAATGELRASWTAPLGRSVVSVAFDPGEIGSLELAGFDRRADPDEGVDVLAFDGITGRVLIGCCPWVDLMLVDVASGAELWRIDGVRPTAATFVLGGSTLAVALGDGTVRLLDAATGALVAGPVEAHDGWADAIGVADDETLFSAGTDGQVRLWSIDGLAAAGTIDLLAGVVMEAVVAGPVDDGRGLVVVDGSLVWEVTTDVATLIEHVCNVVGRDLTEEEWSELLPERPYERTCRSE
jgi:WD40 repeat protein